MNYNKKHTIGEIKSPELNEYNLEENNNEFANGKRNSLNINKKVEVMEFYEKLGIRDPISQENKILNSKDNNSIYRDFNDFGYGNQNENFSIAEIVNQNAKELIDEIFASFP